MKRSITISILAFGAVGLTALGGCARNEPARQPTSSPPFESNVGETRSGGPGQTTTPGVPSGQATESANGPTGSDVRTGQRGTTSDTSRSSMGQEHHGAAPDASSSGQGTSTGTSGMGAPSAEATPTMSEQEMCDALTHDARMHVEDVQGGVAIVLKPRTGGDLSTLQEHARQLDRRMGQSQGSSSGSACDLFALGRSGVTTSIAEAPDAVRILITTSDQNKVQSIRRQAREFVNTNATKSGTQGGRGSGTQGGSSGGGQ